MTDSKLYDSGGIEYTGNEELTYVTFSVIIDDNDSLNAEFHPQENQIAQSLGTTVTNHSRTKDEAIIALNHSYIEIKWQTNLVQ